MTVQPLDIAPVGGTPHRTPVRALALVAAAVMGAALLGPISAEAVPISCTSVTNAAIHDTVTCAPGDYSVTVPSGATYASVVVNGAGGGGDGDGNGGGGGGAQITANIELSGAPGSLAVHVGAGGAEGDNAVIDGGWGGGWSGIAVGGIDQIIAGGGGGGSSDGDGGSASGLIGGTGDGDSFGSASAGGGIGGGATGGLGGAGGASVSSAGVVGLSGAPGSNFDALVGGGVSGGSPVYNLNSNEADHAYGNGGGGSGYGGGGAGGFSSGVAGGGGGGGSYLSGARLLGPVTPVITGNGGGGGADTDPGDDGSVIITFHAPLPTITGVSPANGSPAGGTSVVITGANYIPGTTVTFGGTAAASVVVDSLTQITATTPAHAVGFVDVTVTSVEGTAVVPLTAGFEYTTALPPTPTPNSGGGSTPSATPTATTSPIASSVVEMDLLDPIPNAVNPNIPSGGVPAGGSVFLVDGVPVPVTVAPDAKSDPTGLTVSGPGFNVRLAGRGDVNDPLGLNDKNALILQSDQTARSAARSVLRSVASKAKTVAPVAVAAGDGFKASSAVRFFLLPATYMGELPTDDAGAFAGSVPVPAGLTPGTYTLQMNGFAPTGSVRSLSIGVVVRPSVTVAATKRAKAYVFFEPLSSQISAEGQSTLKALVKKTGKAGIRSVVVGFVQGSTVTSNDEALSTERARAVASYLRSIGLKGAYTVRGNGVAEQPGAKARRVGVTVEYRTK